MAISLVQQTLLQAETAGATSLNFNFGANITPGNFVVVAAAYYFESDTMTVEAAGQTVDYDYDLGPIEDTAFHLYMFENTTGGDDLITIASDATSYIYAAALEFSGVATSSAVDVSSVVNTGTLGDPLSNSTGPLSQAENLALSWTGGRIDNSPSLYAAAPGWTLSNMNVQQWSLAAAGALSWLVTASTAALAPQWLGSPSDPHMWACRTVVLKAAAAPPPAAPGNPIMFGMNF